MSRLYVVRHGETDYNREGRYQGRIDVSLNAAGRVQAERAAERIASLDIDHIFSSPLKRARETAQVIASRLNTSFHCIEGLAERSLGGFEGQTKAEIAEQVPGIWDGRPTRQMFESPPGAESLMELSIRVYSVYQSLWQRYAGEGVLLVCHGGVARTLHGLLNRVSDEEYFKYKLGNGEVDSFNWAQIAEAPVVPRPGDQPIPSPAGQRPGKVS